MNNNYSLWCNDTILNGTKHKCTSDRYKAPWLSYPGYEEMESHIQILHDY